MPDSNGCQLVDVRALLEEHHGTLIDVKHSIIERESRARGGDAVVVEGVVCEPRVDTACDVAHDFVVCEVAVLENDIDAVVIKEPEGRALWRLVVGSIKAHILQVQRASRSAESSTPHQIGSPYRRCSPQTTCASAQFLDAAIVVLDGLSSNVFS